MSSQKQTNSECLQCLLVYFKITWHVRPYRTRTGTSEVVKSIKTTMFKEKCAAFINFVLLNYTVKHFSLENWLIFAIQCHIFWTFSSLVHAQMYKTRSMKDNLKKLKWPSKFVQNTKLLSLLLLWFYWLLLLCGFIECCYKSACVKQTLLMWSGIKGAVLLNIWTDQLKGRIEGKLVL